MGRSHKNENEPTKREANEHLKDAKEEERSYRNKKLVTGRERSTTHGHPSSSFDGLSP
jgi:hypothetical protein